jgi:hypothetical protein
VIQDRAVEAGKDLEEQADLPAEAERVQTIHEAANLQDGQTESLFLAHAMIVTTQNQDVLRSFQEKETTKKIFQNRAEEKHLDDRKIRVPDFPPEAISLFHAHAMIVTIQNQGVHRNSPDQLITQNLPEAKDAILAHAMIAMNQNRVKTNSIALRSLPTKRDSFLN